MNTRDNRSSDLLITREAGIAITRQCEELLNNPPLMTLDAIIASPLPPRLNVTLNEAMKGISNAQS